MKTFKSALLVMALAVPMVSPFALAATPANMLVVAQNINDIVAIDPAQAYEFSSGEYVTQVYDRLVQFDADNLETLGAGLATNWLIDDETKTIVFTLRDDVLFHSGNKLTGADVVYSFERVVNLNKAPAFILTQLGWNAENIHSMVSAKGNTITLKYQGEFSSAFALNVLASRPGSIVDSITVKEHEKDGDWGNTWLNANSAGTGAFKLRTYRPGEILILDANKNYFKGAPKIKSVVIRHVAEPATQQLMLKSGDVDIAKNLTPDQVASLDSDIKVQTFPQAAVHFLSFNQKVESLQPKAVWEAARYLVNYKGMANSFLKGQMEVHQSFWPKGFPGSYNETPYSYNPEKAKQILADAGIKTPITVTLDVINSNPFTDMAQSMQASFAEAGINFEILPGTGSQVITKYRARSHQALLLYWGPDFMDPHSNAKAFAFNEDNSDTHYQSTSTWRNSWAVPKEYNEATKQALAEKDQDKRNAMYIDLQKKTQANSPIIMIFQAQLQIAMQPNVKGYVNGAIADYVFYRLVTK